MGGLLEGTKILENIPLRGPSETALFEGEVPAAPLVFQGTRGPFGVGNVRVHAERELDIRVSGVGSVKYYGNPKNPRLREDGLGSWFMVFQTSLAIRNHLVLVALRRQLERRQPCC